MMAARRRLGSIGRWRWVREPKPGDPYLTPLPGMRILLLLEEVYQSVSGGGRAYLYSVAGATLTWHVFKDGYITSSIEEAEDRLYELIYAISHRETEAGYEAGYEAGSEAG